MNIVWHEHEITKESRAAQKKQRPCIIWFTGLSGSGKSTIAGALEQKLNALSQHTYLLDGDNVRHGLNKDLAFSDGDRIENIRRIGEMSKLFVDAGLIVLSAFISPFRTERRMVRDLVEKGEFIEVHMDTPIDTCETRDPKGLYKKARAGEIKNFTGIDSEYQTPEHAEVVINTATQSIEECADAIIAYLVGVNILQADALKALAKPAPELA
ncbi:MAG: adenylyl-sulfate kinase [Bermanella sp.]